MYGTVAQSAVGMVLANGSTGGLTDFGELIQIIVVKGRLLFIVKSLMAWSVEHLRSFILEKTSTVKVLESTELSDMFPLTSYVLGGKSIVTLKQYICVPLTASVSSQKNRTIAFRPFG